MQHYRFIIYSLVVWQLSVSSFLPLFYINITSALFSKHFCFQSADFFYYICIITIELVSVETVVSLFLHVSSKTVLQVRLECVYELLVLLPKTRNNYKSLIRLTFTRNRFTSKAAKESWHELKYITAHSNGLK